MKYSLLIIFLVFFVKIGLAQDIDIYNKSKNSNYDIPKIEQEMTYSEFKMLSQNVKMKDMMYAIIVPGYIHYKAQDMVSGNWLVGLRCGSYATLGGIYWYIKDQYPNVKIKDLDDGSNQKVLQNLFYGAIGMIFTTYVYDLIRGEVILQDRQEKIRYKYALKLSSQSLGGIDGDVKIVPSLGVGVRF